MVDKVTFTGADAYNIDLDNVHVDFNAQRVGLETDNSAALSEEVEKGSQIYEPAAAQTKTYDED